MVRMISDSIGHDGNSFFCRRCAKAGYRSLAAVKGHLAMCFGTAIQKGAVPASRSQLAAGQDAGLGDLSQPAAAASRSWAGRALFQGSGELASYQQQQQLSQLQPAGNYQQLAAIQQEQEKQRQQINQLMNEYNHMVYTTNAPAGGIDKKWILVGAFVMFLLFFSMPRNCPPCESGTGRSSRSNSNLKDRMVGKASDKAIDYIFRGL